MECSFGCACPFDCVCCLCFVDLSFFGENKEGFYSLILFSGYASSI